MAAILGRKIGVFTPYTEASGTLPVDRLIGMSTSCSLNCSADVVEMAALSARGKKFRVGRYEYTVQIDCLYDGGGMIKHLTQSFMDRTLLDWTMAGADRLGGVDLSSLRFSGKAYVVNFTETAPVGDYATASVTLKGSGELEIY